MERLKGLLAAGIFVVVISFLSVLSAANFEVNPAGAGQVEISYPEGSMTLSGTTPKAEFSLPSGEGLKASYNPDQGRLDLSATAGQPNVLFPTMGITILSGQNLWVLVDERGRPVEIGLPCPNPDGLVIYFPDGSYLTVPACYLITIKYLADGTFQLTFNQTPGCETRNLIYYTDAKGKMRSFGYGETLNIAGYMALPDWRLESPVERGAASPPIM